MSDDLKDFESFLNNTYAIMLNYCKSHGQKHEDADEIVNDAFSRMWRAWEKCAPMDTVRRKKWLYNTIENIIHERNRKRVPSTIDVDECIDELVNEVDDELVRAFENFKYDIYVDRIRDILPKSEWELFEYVVIKQRTYQEAAKALGRSVTVAYVQMARIRAKIEARKEEIFR